MRASRLGPHDWEGWYRNLLLRDDKAIATIWRKLRGLAVPPPSDLRTAAALGRRIAEVTTVYCHGHSAVRAKEAQI